MKERLPKKAELDAKYILKTYWNFLKKHKLLMFGTMLVVMIVTALSFIGRYFFKIIIDNGELYTKNEITSQAFTQIIGLIGIFWIAVLGGNALMRWIRIHLLNKLEIKMMFELKQYYYSHILNLSHKFHTTHKTGSLISRITRGSSAIERLTDFIVFNTLPLFFELIISGLALMALDKRLGLIVLATGTILVVFSGKLQKFQRKLTTLTNEAEDREKAMIGDTFTNIDSIKYYGKEDIVKNKYASIAEKTRNSMFRQWQVYRWISSGEGLITGAGSLGVLFLSINLFLKGTITLGTVTFAWALYGTLIETLRMFMDGLRGYNRSIADFHDLFQYGKISNDIKNKLDAKNLEIKEGVIEFKNVSFKYQENGLFNNFNLIVTKNKKIALVGHSGSGKSTLVKLLYRLYDLDKGQITIDNKNIKEVNQESLRSELSIVPQECVLFDDTIYNNILFSNPKASNKEVMQAIKFAQLDKTISLFPYKEHTIVGERGVKLSGGEKQRVSIARAILANKKILVLDEATSSLDSKTEHEIQRDLQRLMQNRTSLIIAHRLSTIMTADIIVVLDKGKIVQQGTHNQLISKSGTYRELWNLQKGGYIGE